ncbi:MAG: hypothetical protein EPO27_19410 [Betaproteobacteria bacterium]|nr:MAG: hypothetical protein EPO27_19410 [Betaproteobacteria bacterium]
MRIAPFAVALLFAAGLARADTPQDALSEIARCADVADSAARLRCFDAAVPRAKKALAEHQAREKRGFLDWFGFARPPKPVTRPEDFGKPPAAEPGEINQITAMVAEFAKTPRGKSIFILDNGQVWRQLDSDTDEIFELAPGKPMKVTIEAGTFGGYNLSIEGRNGIVKVRRLK